MGKAKIGISDLQFAVLKDDIVSGEVIKLPGTTEAKLELTMDIATLPADNVPYLTISSGISEAKLTLNNYDVNSEVKKALYGIDVVNGIEIYDKKLLPNDVAIMYKTALDDGKEIYVAMLKGKFTLPGMNSKTTGDGSPDPETDEIEGSFVARKVSDRDVILLIGRSDVAGFKFEEFKKVVFPATAEEAVIPAPSEP